MEERISVTAAWWISVIRYARIASSIYIRSSGRKCRSTITIRPHITVDGKLGGLTKAGPEASLFSSSSIANALSFIAFPGNDEPDDKKADDHEPIGVGVGEKKSEP